jgi:subtilisin-like proprotein convertase family protein
VYIGITHGCFADLDITLVSPAGREVMLSEWGNTGLLKSGGKKLLIFDDQAAVAIMATNQLISGKSYKPAALLSALNNTDSYGTWKIKISDHIYDSSGTLDYVRLAVSNPEPATLGLLSLGFMMLRGKRHV